MLNIFNKYLLSQYYKDSKDEKAKIILDNLERITNYNDILNIIPYSNTHSQNNTDIVNELHKVDLSRTIRVSAIMIVRNEERCIEKSINSLIKIVDHIIIVDTGSTDHTIEIIKQYTNDKIQLYHFKWCNDFSKARNYALSLSKTDWSFFIDADEYNFSETYESIHVFLSIFSHFKYKNNIVICPEFTELSTNKIHFGVGRIIYTHGNLKYYGKIHEELRTKNENDIVISIQSNIKFFHDGYTLNIIEKKHKIERNTLLLKDMINEEPNNYRWKYLYLRDGFQCLNDQTIEEIVIPSLFKNKQLSFKNNNIVLNSYTLPILSILCRYYMGKNRLELARQICNLMNEIDKENFDSVFFSNILKIIEIKSYVVQLLNQITLYRKDHFNFQINTLNENGYHIDLLIGVLLYENDKYNEARKYFDFLKDKNEINEFKPLISKYLDYINTI